MRYLPRPLVAAAARLRGDRSGVAMLEFALSAPIVLLIGGYGIETANLAVVNLKVSQIALGLADNASRVGTWGTNLSTQQLREVDVNDVLEAAAYQGRSINLATNGRITLSSLENIEQSYDDDGPVQRIHWQRCYGAKSGSQFDSTYTTSTAAGTTASSSNAGTNEPNGMGSTANEVNAPSGAGVMYVEISYQTQPLFGGWLMRPSILHYTASFIVRDNRDFSQIYNPSPTATRSTCDKHSSTVPTS